MQPPPMPSSSPQPTAAARRRSSPAHRTESAASGDAVPPKAVDVVLRELRPPASDVTPFAGRRLITGPDHREEWPRATSRDRSGMDERTNPPVRADLDDTRGTLVPVSTAAAQRIVVAPQAAPYRPPRDQGPAAQADAAPVVNVTIGRLEVRALPAAAAAKPRSERRAAQPMSLDDYFKQRRGER